jgi:hypothetical protein
MSKMNTARPESPTYHVNHELLHKKIAWYDPESKAFVTGLIISVTMPSPHYRLFTITFDEEWENEVVNEETARRLRNMYLRDKTTEKGSARQLHSDIFDFVIYFLEDDYEVEGASEKGAAFNLLYSFINSKRGMRKLFSNTLLKKAFEIMKEYHEYKQYLDSKNRPQFSDLDCSSESDREYY